MLFRVLYSQLVKPTAIHNAYQTRGRGKSLRAATVAPDTIKLFSNSMRKSNLNSIPYKRFGQWRGVGVIKLPSAC
jgi:hypothetical protein